MRLHECTWMQIERYLERDDRIVLPLGSTEQHGYLSLGVDAILAERVSAEAAEPLGVPVAPVMPYGLAPYFAAYPGSPTLQVGTYSAVLGAIHSGMPTVLSTLAALRDMDREPGMVMTGTPIHRLSQVVVPPLYGMVSSAMSTSSNKRR